MKLKNKLKNKLNKKLVSLLLIIMVTLAASFFAACAEKKGEVAGTTGGGGNITDGTSGQSELDCTTPFTFAVVGNADSTDTFEFAAGTLSNQAAVAADSKTAQLQVVKKDGCGVAPSTAYILLSTKTVDANTISTAIGSAASGATSIIAELTASANVQKTLIANGTADAEELTVACTAPDVNSPDTLSCVYTGKTHYLKGHAIDIAAANAAITPATLPLYVIEQANDIARNQAVTGLENEIAIIIGGSSATKEADITARLAAFTAAAKEITFTASAKLTKEGEPIPRSAACKEGATLQLVNDPADPTVNTDSTTLFEFNAGILSNKADTDADGKTAYLQAVANNSNCTEVYRLISKNTFTATDTIVDAIASVIAGGGAATAASTELNTGDSTKLKSVNNDPSFSLVNSSIPGYVHGDIRDLDVACAVPTGASSVDTLKCAYTGITKYASTSSIDLNEPTHISLQDAGFSVHALPYASDAVRADALTALDAAIAGLSGDTTAIAEALNNFVADAMEVPVKLSANLSKGN